MEENIRKKRLSKTNLLLILLILSLAANAFFFLNSTTGKVTEKTYRLIDPLVQASIDADEQEESAILHYRGLRSRIIADVENITNISNVGVFVQDVKTGAWMGINEREGFIPSSLLKIPLMLAVLKKVEQGEIKLTDTIILIEKDLEAGSGELYRKGAGAQLTVWELLKEMIAASDNTAKNVLLRQVSDNDLNAVFAHVGISKPNLTTRFQVTPRGYNRFFKLLYFSTFLSPELSEKALDLTTDTQEEDLLSAGVPVEIQVAHKYGSNMFGLHDCGIVYHTKNPYFICVMTKDIYLETGQELIVKISRDVFEFVDKQ